MKYTALLLGALVAFSIVAVVASFTKPAFATDTNWVGAAYRSNTGTNTLNSIKYREWNASSQTWSAETELSNLGSPVRAVKLNYDPSSELKTIVAATNDAKYWLEWCTHSCTTAANWHLYGGTSFDSKPHGAPGTGTTWDIIDAKMVGTSGKLLIAYDNDGVLPSCDTTEAVTWRTFNVQTQVLSGATKVTYASSGTCSELSSVRIDCKPTGTECIVVLNDNQLLSAYAYVYDGTSFGNKLTLSSNTGTFSNNRNSISANYEHSSGFALATSGNGNSMAWARWNGTAWSSVLTQDTDSAQTTESIGEVWSEANPLSSSNRIMVCAINNASHAVCGQENGGTWGSWTTVTTATRSANRGAVGFCYDSNTSTGLVIYGKSTNSGTEFYRTFNGTTFGTENTKTAAVLHNWYGCDTNPTSGDANKQLWLKQNSNFDIGSMKWDGSTLTVNSDNDLTADVTVDNFRAMDIKFQKSTSSAVFTVTASETQTTAESITKAVTKSISESFASSDAYSDLFGKTLTDSWNIVSAASSLTDKALSDPLTSGESLSMSFSKLIADTMTTSEDYSNTITKVLSDTVTVFETYGESASIFIQIAEGLTVSEGLSFVNSIYITIHESLTFAENFDTVTQFHLVFDESWHLFESLNQPELHALLIGTFIALIGGAVVPLFLTPRVPVLGILSFVMFMVLAVIMFANYEVIGQQTASAVSGTGTVSAVDSAAGTNTTGVKTVQSSDQLTETMYIDTYQNVIGFAFLIMGMIALWVFLKHTVLAD